jgi:hypothetical protein
VRVLLADEPTGEEPLAGILEYALQTLVTNNVHRFSCLGKKFAGPRAEQGRPLPRRRVRTLLPASATGFDRRHPRGVILTRVLVTAWLLALTGILMAYGYL